MTARDLDGKICTDNTTLVLGLMFVVWFPDGSFDFRFFCLGILVVGET